jgi:hypothetical protein
MQYFILDKYFYCKTKLDWFMEFNLPNAFYFLRLAWFCLRGRTVLNDVGTRSNARTNWVEITVQKYPLLTHKDYSEILPKECK